MPHPASFTFSYPLRQGLLCEGRADHEVFLLGSPLGMSPRCVVGSGQPGHLGQNIVQQSHQHDSYG